MQPHLDPQALLVLGSHPINGGPKVFTVLQGPSQPLIQRVWSTATRPHFLNLF